MNLKVGTPVLSNGDGINIDTAIGVIVDIDKNENAKYPYRIIFSDDDDDWYSNSLGAVTDMALNFNKEIGYGR